jgi:predicted DCC family thiol-disulfide oxidoreductase YuxK
MNTHAITVYYDGSCRLCSAEINSLKKLDADERIALVDCSAPDFDDTPFRALNIVRSDMMNALHIRDAANVWHTGVDAFVVLYRTAGLPAIGAFWAHPLTRPFTTRLYPWVVRNRYLLSKLGLPRVMDWLGHLYALRAHRKAQACARGQCHLPGGTVPPTSTSTFRPE